MYMPGSQVAQGRRIKLQHVSGDTVLNSKLVICPDSLEELYQLCKEKFSPTFGLNDKLKLKVEGADLDDIILVREGDTIQVFSENDLTGLSKRGSMASNYLGFMSSMGANALKTPSASLDWFAAMSSAADFTASTMAMSSGRMVARKKRHRRTFVELARNHQCHINGCGRLYASENSLIQHIRIKHPDAAPEIKGRGGARTQVFNSMLQDYADEEAQQQHQMTQEGEGEGESGGEHNTEMATLAEVDQHQQQHEDKQEEDVVVVEEQHSYGINVVDGRSVAVS